MSKQMQEREFHRVRIAKRLIRSDLYGMKTTKYGLQTDWAEQAVDGGRWFCITDSDKTIHWYRYGSVHVYYHLRNPNLVPRELTLLDMTRWEAEELDVKDKLLYVKKATEKGSLLHRNKKDYRTEYNRRRRQAGRRYGHHCQYDRQDWADDHFDHAWRKSFLYDIS